MFWQFQFCSAPVTSLEIFQIYISVIVNQNGLIQPFPLIDGVFPPILQTQNLFGQMAIVNLSLLPGEKKIDDV